MKKEHIKLCSYYNRSKRKYDLYFPAILELVKKQPNIMMKEFYDWMHKNYPELETNDFTLRILNDARRVQAHEKNKDYSEIATLEDGQMSDLSWKTIKHKKLLVLSDIHFPYHDRTALMLALREGRKQNVDAILLNGDILDFYQLSKFTKDGSKPSIAKEFEIFRFFIDQLKQRFPDTAIYYKTGNHELRLDHWMKNHAQVFNGLIDIDMFVDFKSHGVVYLKDNIGVKFGKLNIIHGHEIKAGGQYLAKSYHTKTGSNVLFGHWHQNQQYTFKNLDGQKSGAWAIGCLCKLDAEYTFGHNTWSHGFAIVELIDDSGNFRVHHYTEEDFKFL